MLWTRIPASCTNQGNGISSACCIVFCIPGVWKLARADRFISCTAYKWINCKYKGCNGITASGTDQGYRIGSGSQVAVGVPTIRQGTAANGNIGGACYNRINCKVQRCNGIATCCTGGWPGPAINLCMRARWAGPGCGPTTRITESSPRPGARWVAVTC